MFGVAYVKPAFLGWEGGSHKSHRMEETIVKSAS